MGTEKATLLEREFFRAAANWLACRHEVMTLPFEDIPFAQLGEHDYWQEMKLILKEIKTMKERLCYCGSGETSYELYDARGIYVQRVCDKCIEDVKSHFRPEIFRDSDYWTCEDIDND